MRSIRLACACALVLLAASAEAAVTFRSVSEFATSNTGNKTMTEPASCANGDAEAFLAAADAGHSLTAPAGWTIPTGYGPTTQGTVQFVAGYIIRSGGAPNLTWGFTGTGYLEIEIVCLTNGATVAFDAASAAGTTSAAIVTPDPPSVTAVASTSIAVAGGINFGSSGTWTASTNYTLRSSAGAGGSRDNFVETRALVASGAENPAAATMSAGSGDGWNGFTLTFTDGGGGGGGATNHNLTLTGAGPGE